MRSPKNFPNETLRAKARSIDLDRVEFVELVGSLSARGIAGPAVPPRNIRDAESIRSLREAFLASERSSPEEQPEGMTTDVKAIFRLQDGRRVSFGINRIGLLQSHGPAVYRAVERLWGPIDDGPQSELESELGKEIRGVEAKLKALRSKPNP